METIAPELAVEFVEMEGHERRVWVRSITNDGGSITVPYLSWTRPGDDSETDQLLLVLDNRLGYQVPAGFTAEQENALVEFIANAIAIGAGYPSIYYTNRKMPFRG